MSGLECCCRIKKNYLMLLEQQNYMMKTLLFRKINLKNILKRLILKKILEIFSRNYISGLKKVKIRT